MATKNIQINYYNGSSYDILYPEIGITVINGNYTGNGTWGDSNINKIMLTNTSFTYGFLLIGGPIKNDSLLIFGKLTTANNTIIDFDEFNNSGTLTVKVRLLVGAAPRYFEWYVFSVEVGNLSDSRLASYQCNRNGDIYYYSILCV